MSGRKSVPYFALTKLRNSDTAPPPVVTQDDNDETPSVFKADGRVATKIRFTDIVHRMAMALLLICFLIYGVLLMSTCRCEAVYEEFDGYDMVGVSVIDDEEFTVGNTFYGQILTKNPWLCARNDKSARTFFTVVICILLMIVVAPLALLRIKNGLAELMSKELATGENDDEPDYVTGMRRTQPGNLHAALHTLTGVILLTIILGLGVAAIHMGIDDNEGNRIDNEESFDHFLIAIASFVALIGVRDLIFAVLAARHLYNSMGQDPDASDKPWQKVTKMGFHVVDSSKQAVAAYGRYVTTFLVWLLVGTIAFIFVTVRSHDVLPNDTPVEFRDVYIENYRIQAENDSNTTGTRAFADVIQLVGPSTTGSFIVYHLKGARNFVYVGAVVTVIMLLSVMVVHILSFAGKFAGIPASRSSMSILDSNFLRSIDFFHLFLLAANFILAYSLVLFMFHPVEDNKHPRATMYVFAAFTAFTVLADWAALGISSLAFFHHTTMLSTANKGD